MAAPRDDLPAVLVAHPGDHRRRGSEYGQLARLLPHELGEAAGLPHHVFVPLALEQDADHASEGGIAQRLPVGDLPGEKGPVVVRLRAGDAVVALRIGLHDHLAAQLAPPGPPGHLRQQLKGPFAGPEVGEVEGGVGRDDAHERHVREIEALGHHLRAEQDIRFLVQHAVVDVLVGAFPRRGVHVHSDDPGAREPLLQLLLDALGAHAPVSDRRGPALRADLRRLVPVVAVMAPHEQAVGVVGHRHAAMGTGHGVPAVVALDEGGEPPPVQEEDDLLPPVEAVPDPFGQGAGENRQAAQPALFPHVDDPHARQGAPVHPRGQAAACELAVPRIGVGLQGRRRAAQDRHGVHQAGPDHRHVPRMVERRVVELLVGRFVFLVDDDQAEVGQRGEHGGAGAHDDAVVPGAGPPPGVVPLSRGQAAVQDGHEIPEMGAELPHGLRGQGELRDEHDGRPARRQGLFYGFDVHVRLPAAGDAVEQQGLERAFADGAVDRAQRLGLLLRGIDRVRFGQFGVPVGVPYRLDLAERHQALFLQSPHHGPFDPPQVTELFRRQPAVVPRQKVDAAGLPGRARQQPGHDLRRLLLRRDQFDPGLVPDGRTAGIADRNRHQALCLEASQDREGLPDAGPAPEAGQGDGALFGDEGEQFGLPGGGAPQPVHARGGTRTVPADDLFAFRQQARGQGRLDRFAPRAEVVTAYPARQLEQRGVHDRVAVEDVQQRPVPLHGTGVRKRRDDAGHPAVREGDGHPVAGQGRVEEIIWNAVGEYLVDRKREGYFGKPDGSRHRL